MSSVAPETKRIRAAGLYLQGPKEFGRTPGDPAGNEKERRRVPRRRSEEVEKEGREEGGDRSKPVWTDPLSVLLPLQTQPWPLERTDYFL